MTKITFMGAGSTVFAKNLLGDCLLTPCLYDSHIALYDIDAARLNDSKIMLENLNQRVNQNRAQITGHIGVENRREALNEADFVINAIQVGGYEPATVIDFEIPKKYGLRQTIGDTIGVGGIFRALRTIPVLVEFAEDMMAVCPEALLLNYTNPMSILTGYIQRYTPIKTVGLCHSVQVCAEHLLKDLGIKTSSGLKWKCAGINHMCWLLELQDSCGKDLYPEVRRRALKKNDDAFRASSQHHDMVRYEILRHFGYYNSESSEHTAEYHPYFIKNAYPELVEKLNIPIDEYPRRCISQIEGWKKQREELVKNASLTHEKTNEYSAQIIEAVIMDKPVEIAGNIVNSGLITNLPTQACVEVPCLVNRNGVQGCFVGALPEALAALNRTHINVHLLTIEAARTLKKDAIYQAAMLDPHTRSELTLDKIRALCDDLIAAHGDMMPTFT